MKIRQQGPGSGAWSSRNARDNSRIQADTEGQETADNQAAGV